MVWFYVVIPEVEEMNKHRCSRVEVDYCAWLTFDNKRLQPHRVYNLSMVDVCILNEKTLETGDKCTFELHDLDRAYCFFARVAWKKDGRFALEFVEIPPDSSFFLQTILHSHTDDPSKLVDEFQEE